MSIGDRRILEGTVSSFDDPVGLGTVTDDEGVVHPFHCTAIADGSRHVEEGARVSFGLRAGRGGRVEATGLVVTNPTAGGRP